MRHADYVVTEAGFGADMGAEKFFNIKCRNSGMQPDATLLVATVRALKTHSGAYDVKPGRPLPEELGEEHLENLAAGCANLEAQIANVLAHGVPVVVAVNRFPTDTDAEVELVRERALAAGARAAEVSLVHGQGGAGGEAIGRAILEAAESGEASYRSLYADEAPLREKLEALATRLYGASSVLLEPQAAAQLARIEAAGHGHLPSAWRRRSTACPTTPSARGARPTSSSPS